jgi:hypothetical protein
MKKSIQENKKHLNDMLTFVALSKVFCNATLLCYLKGNFKSNVA